MGKNISKYCYDCWQSSSETKSLMPHEKFPQEESKVECVLQCPSHEVGDLNTSSDLHIESEHIPQDFYSALQNSKAEFIESLAADESILQVLRATTDVTVTGRDDSSGFLLKAVWTVPVTPRQFLDYYSIIEERPKWDRSIFSVLQDQNFPTVSHTIFKQAGLLPQRELLLVTEEFEHNGGLLLVSCSISHPDYPEQESSVRVNLFFGGYFVVPLSPTHSRITQVSHCEFKGAVPKAIIKNLTAVTMPKLVKNLNGQLCRYYSTVNY